MVSASDGAVDKRLYVNRQSESVVKSAYVSVTTDRTLDCIVRTLNYVFCARRDSIERNSYGNVAGWLGVRHTAVLYQNG